MTADSAGGDTDVASDASISGAAGAVRCGGGGGGRRGGSGGVRASGGGRGCAELPLTKIIDRRPREIPVAMNRTSIKHIDSHGETPRFCTMTCPIDGGATLSCHRHTDMSTASAAGRYYAPASKALQPTGVTLPEGSLASPPKTTAVAMQYLI